MPAPQPHFPPIPADTGRAAQSIFGKGNVYLKLGDRVEDLFCDLPLTRFDSDRTRAIDAAICALISAFQYAEGLTDARILEAIRKRVDLKYALHLSLNYPPFDARLLCRFRQSMLAGGPSRAAFAELLQRLAGMGLFSSSCPAGVDPVLETICTANRIETITEVMARTLETLATIHPDWLRRVLLPHWYLRYRGVWEFGAPGGETLLGSLAADMRYLMEAIETSGHPNLAAVPEVVRLRQILKDPSERCSPGTSKSQSQWRRPAVCSADSEIFDFS